jgi:glycosyltransferase involved in cell wall biosynthesis
VRLLHVFAGPYPTAQGTQVLVGQICRLLAREGHDVHLLSYAHSGRPETPDFTVHRIPDLPRFHSERSGLAVRKLLLDASLAAATRRLRRRLTPDLVHAHHYEALLSARLADPLHATPLVFHAHALMEPELSTYFPVRVSPAATRAGRAVDEVLPRLADGVVAVSEAVQTGLASVGIPAERIRVVPPPLEGFPAPPRRDADGARGVSGRGGDAPPVRAAYAGNLDGYQDLPLLLDALELVPPDIRARLVVEVITASDPTALLRNVSARGLCDLVRVVDHGAAAEALERLAGADIALLPRTRPGGAPIKLVNYLGAGLPVVLDERLASDLTHERDAFVVNMERPEDVAAALIRLSADRQLRAELSRGARSAAARLFESGRVYALLMEAYDIAIKR